MTVFPIHQGSEVEPNFPNIACKFLSDVTIYLFLISLSADATFRVLAPNKYKAKQHLEYVKNISACMLREREREKGREKERERERERDQPVILILLIKL